MGGIVAPPGRETYPGGMESTDPIVGPAPEQAADGQAPSHGLPAPLQRLLAELGRELVDVERVTARPSRSPKAAWRLEFADGSLCKGRLLIDEPSAARVEAIAGRLKAEPGIARVWARDGAALLEEWLPGTPLACLEGAQAEACGGLLARLHALPLPEGEPAFAVGEEALAELCARLAGLCQAGRLSAAQCQRLEQRAVRLCPARGRRSVIHFDACAENLLQHATRGLVLIDNETLRYGPCGLDLGRALWRISEQAGARLLAGYRQAGGPAQLELLPFWLLSAQAASAWFRWRDAMPGAEEPLRGLWETAGGEPGLVALG